MIVLALYLAGFILTYYFVMAALEAPMPTPELQELDEQLTKGLEERDVIYLSLLWPLFIALLTLIFLCACIAALLKMKG